MTFENVQVQYDEPNHLLWIRGNNHDKQTYTNSGESTTTETETTPNGKKDVPTTTMKSVNHYEFSQTFALDPNIVNVEHLTASFDENNVLTVVVPKYEQVDDANQKPAIRTIPITTTGNATTTAEATSTSPGEVKELAMTHWANEAAVTTIGRKYSEYEKA